MGVRLYPDQSAERATGAIVERIFVKEIAAVCGEMWSCKVRASNSCSFVATATASRSLRPPSPTRRLRLSNREYLEPRFRFKLIADASWSTVVVFICRATTLLPQFCAQT